MAVEGRTMRLSFTVNRCAVTIDTDGARMLVWVLRSDLGLTGTKVGCGEGHCGACTVLVDGEAIRSCSLPVSEVADKEVTTIEGLEQDGKLHPIQEAFLDHHAFQCGYCTPGMILSAHALLRKNPRPSRQEVVTFLEGNLCRCGSHPRILDAVEAAAKGDGK
jgi:aerobic-type carbon monoxide dehydrogenase small subunit (CoxS/CutS family)